MRGSHQPLHPETRMALADVRRAGGKAILLLNRRGWSNFLSCRALRAGLAVPRTATSRWCSIARAGSSPATIAATASPCPERCPDCASVSVARHGAGTERIEHELREALGEDRWPIFRLDADSATLRARARTLQRFQAAPAGVLVGTQMVAKGHDFPDVSLGVVLDADQTLRFPDFRAEERTFALITQLAGRTGRGAHGGRVLVQTLAPDARSIGFAVHPTTPTDSSPTSWSHRLALRYPPYASLIRIVASARGGAAGA